ncbi:response regulator [Chitinilyticum piscinae]|uniref:Response regulator n=1 Tax=Chitinilyticum piscinae TaxID=2866724 RepID=A0A8J7FPY5_9NEIS|nr:response regulator [Chitinilyticum piscinae]MBE9610079.1 response regulator [Chitinilyticum piscinae]
MTDLSRPAGRVLVVDDEPFNLEILSEHLQDAGYEVVLAEDGLQGWEILTSDEQGFDAILLDRMMPRMNGMELLARIKQRGDLQHVPVIMQTAVGAAENVQEGLAAGAYYYLIKPFQREMLLAIVSAAVSFHHERVLLERQLAEQVGAYRMLERGEFSFRSLDEARQLTLLLSQTCPEPQRVALGISELLVNAVEHGNLGIRYSDKTRLLQTGRWQEEIENRLRDPLFGERRVRVLVESSADYVSIRIEDEGEGFDWQPYLQFSPERAFDPHGRGISMAKLMSFDELEYQGRGNCVVARVRR